MPYFPKPPTDEQFSDEALRSAERKVASKRFDLLTDGELDSWSKYDPGPALMYSRHRDEARAERAAPGPPPKRAAPPRAPVNYARMGEVVADAILAAETRIMGKVGVGDGHSVLLLQQLEARQQGHFDALWSALDSKIIAAYGQLEEVLRRDLDNIVRRLDRAEASGTRTIRVVREDKDTS